MLFWLEYLFWDLSFRHSTNWSASPETAAQDAAAIVIATEWEEFRQLDLVALSEVMRGKTLFDARNMLQINDKRLKDFTYLRIGI